MDRPDCEERGCDREADDAVEFINPHEYVPFCWSHAVEKLGREDARGIFDIQ